MDIQQIMQLLAARQQGGGQNPMQGVMGGGMQGALGGGMPLTPMMPGAQPTPPDYNSLLQRALVDQQAEAQARQQEHMNMMGQRFAARQMGNAPQGFGAGQMQQPQMQAPQQGQAPTQPAGIAQRPRMGGAFNEDISAY